VERVPAAFAGDERVIAFNPLYLLDGLTAAATPWQDATGKPGGGADADEASGPGRAATGAGPAGRIRLEFTTSARPAVISWVAGDTGGDAEGGEPGQPDAEPDTAGGDGAAPGFRYLVVPLRMPGSG
jgi:DNA polymerase III sliding clamp (beta) subunit (PCNA family)